MTQSRSRLLAGKLRSARPQSVRDTVLSNAIRRRAVEAVIWGMPVVNFDLMYQEMVKTLDQREATILRYRFGLDGGSEKTLEEVGQKFGVTRERVRQIQNIALNKLRKMIEKLEAQQK